MSRRLFSPRFLKVSAWFILLTMVQEVFWPIAAHALTGGPSQPEVQSFEPAGTTEMVDLFSGDFTYNIPLLSVGNYPINLAYHGGIGMEQEASWVGLGWNINVGTINRQKRGIPDDFNENDIITKETSMLPNRTVSMDLGKILKKQREFVGFKLNNLVKKIHPKLQIPTPQYYFNNYKGLGISYSLVKFEKGPLKMSVGYDNQSGMSVSPSLSFSQVIKSQKQIANGEERLPTTLNGSIAANYNSRSGLQRLSLGVNLDHDKRNNGLRKLSRMMSTFANSASISFANPTATPSVSPSMYSGSYELALKLGKSLKFKYKGRTLGATYSVQGISQTEQTYRPIGYLYAEKQGKYPDAMYDVNRENDQGLNRYSQLSAVPNQTYDIYSVSGQGVGGMFRPYRNSVGVLSDPGSKIAEQPINGVELGAELGANASGDLKIGADIGINFNYGKSGNWDPKDLVASNTLVFNSWSTGNSNEEPVYFKRAGELTRVDQDYYNKLGNNAPVRIELTEGFERHNLKSANILKKFVWNSTINNQEATQVADLSSTALKREKRDRRSAPYIHLTAEQAANHGLNKQIKSYSPVNPELYATSLADQFTLVEHFEDIPRTGSFRKSNHISEITSTNIDGTRYVYGIPAYNVISKDVTFNATDLTVNTNDGVVSYTAGQDNSKDNDLGRNHMYSSETTSAYAHSYLLTAVLANNYIDQTGDGPSLDDIGDFTKINYTRAYTDYKWRIPYNQEEANFNEGYLSDSKDQMASYSYGEKEVWYMHSIESKTHKAYFYTSERSDALEVADEDGGPGSRHLRKLDKIELYTLNELKLAEVEGRKAVPLKTVHFEYESNIANQLCQGIPNSSTGGGKLTLKRVWFTYGSSLKGQLSPYEFEYATALNYNYHPKGFDRWGNYMPTNYHGYPNAERPYTPQEEPSVDNWSAAWSISKITLPSGGTINIEYESDDYAYVQDRKAMQMINILGFGPNTDPNDASDKLFVHKTLDDDIINSYVFFNLPNSSSSDINDYCPDDMEFLYVNTKVDLTRSGDYEYVGGYYPIDHSNKGIVNGNIGYVKLDEADLNDNLGGGTEAHPISKQAWQFARINRSALVYPGSNTMDADKPVLEVAKAMIGSVNEIYKMVTGFNRALRDKSYASKVDLTHTWGRFYVNTGFKKGGGHRVSKIYIQDQMEGTKIYGQEYDYTMWDENSGKVISSGVAAYEPMLGGDENPFREMLHAYKVKNKLAPNDFMYDEGPIGESFYPGPSVGYRKVTVKSLSDPTTKKHATGKTVHEFYTAFDFPVITDYTPIQADFSPKFKIAGLVGFSRDFSTASQGFSIELNDMHGKPKAEWTYAEKLDNSPTQEEAPLSGVEYVYHTEGDNPKQLSNSVQVLNADGTLETSQIGVDIDLTVDARQSEVYSGSTGVELNLDLANLGFPIPAFTVLPSSTSLNYNRTRIVSTTKVVQKYGLIKKVIAYKSGASLTTENLAFDQETGDVLLTKTQNEYNNYNYSTKIPAHWISSNAGMGPAYKNINTRVELDLSSNPAAIDPNVDLVPGDELIDINGEQRIWVLSVDGTQAHFIDRYGQEATTNGSKTFRVIRSGRRNLIGVTASTYTHQDDQLIASNRYIPSGNTSWDRVVTASSAEYRDEWQTPYPSTGGCYKKYKFDLWVKYYHQMINKIIQSGLLSQIDETGCNGYDMSVTVYENGKFFYGYNPYLLKVHQSSTTQTIDKVELGLNLKTSPASGNLYRQSSFDYVAVEGITGSFGLYNSSNTYIGGSYTRTFDITFPYEYHKHFMYYSPNYYNHANCNGCTVINGYPGSDKTQYDLINPLETFAQSPTSVTAYDLWDWLNFSCPTTPVGAPNYNFPLFAQNKSYQAYYDFRYALEDPSQFLVHQHHKTGNSTANTHGNTTTYMPTYESDKTTSSYSNYLTHQYKTYYNYGEDSLVISLVDYGGCYDCSSSKTVVNPYVEGTKGNWQVKTNYVYFDKANPDRTSSVSSLTANKNDARMKDDGFLPTGFKLFYAPDNSSGSWVWNKDAGASSKWTWSEKTSQMDRQGNVVETENALGIYSSALYSHTHNNVPIAVASNAKREEITYSGFEEDNDLAYAESWMCSYDRHLDFASLYSANIQVVDDHAHTGISSLKIGAGASGNVTSLLNVTKDRETTPLRSFGNTYTIDDYNKLQEFSLKTGKDYVLSYWVKADNLDTEIILKYNGCDLGSGASLVTLTDLAPSSVAIDGWKKVEVKFNLPGSATDVCFEVANAGSTDGYLDDIRIFPLEGNLKSFVYHPYTLRLWAELDENNYATFYEYDQEGKLVRVKKETERGIQTIQENRSGIIKH